MDFKNFAHRFKWKHLPAHETSWIHAKEVKHQLSFSLENKLSLVNGGIDMLKRVYVRRRKEEGKKEDVGSNDELALTV